MGNTNRPVTNPTHCLDDKISQLCDQPQQLTSQQLNFQPQSTPQPDNPPCNPQSSPPLEQLHGIRKQKLSISMQALKKIINQGNTIVSGLNGQKYLVHFIKFDKQQDYIDYTDTLIYRLKMLRSCHKARRYLNKVVGIYGEKMYVCSGCSPCALYRVYVLQEYFPNSLESLFQDVKLTYSDMCDIFHSFVKVMSAYQYKRLRFGRIDFSKIFITHKDATKDQSKNSTQFLQNQSYLSDQRSRQYDPIIRSKQKKQQNFICKISDPFISEYIKKSKIQPQKPKSPLIDIYKEDVLKIGKILSQILNEKNAQKTDMQQSPIKKEQENKIKNFMQKLVNNYMICGINNRYNWLQIQRYFQQLQHNDKTNLPASMIQSFKTHHDYKPTISSEADLKSYSAEKNIGKPFSYYVPETLRTGVMKNMNQYNLGQNKQNISENVNTYITLKPYKKSDSKPNILTNPSTQTNIPSIQVPSPKNQLLKPQDTHLPQSLIPPVSSQQFPSSPIFHQPPSPVSLGTFNQIPANKIAQIQKNSGYGVVQNLHPEKSPNQRIKYQSLYNIGKCWIKFQGNFQNGSKQGPGTIYLSNGHIFTGFFEKDLANGKGSVYVNGELVLKGTWKDNILITEF